VATVRFLRDGEVAPGGAGTSGGGTNGVVDGSLDAGLEILQVRLVALESVSPVQPRSLDSAVIAPSWFVLLEWTSAPQGRHVVETSPDLSSWSVLEPDAVETVEGKVHARCRIQRPEAAFYRVRRIP
jgi:hypothetical protein